MPSQVLIVGESGSGKELVARDLHRFGPQPSGPFVAINCAALPESLVESELFGHERGAFTGAISTRKGAFEAAERGTLFLDEIGELPLQPQAKLLRVLEERQVTRLGGTKPVKVEARIVAATNRDLEAEVRAGRFREDLYFRLAVHVVRVPPLRERLSDIPALAEQFLTGICARFGMRRKKIAPDALDLLMAYEWRRNNVRELRNVVERMIIAADGEVIAPEHVPLEIRSVATTAHPASAGARLPGAEGGGGAADHRVGAGAARLARDADGAGPRARGPRQSAQDHAAARDQARREWVGVMCPSGHIGTALRVSIGTRVRLAVWRPRL